jgi:putative ABC transport system permease protein
MNFFLGEITNIASVSLVFGFIYGIMALGVFITFRILDFPDLTVDGSFPLGAAIMALFIINGLNLFTGLIIVFMGGVLAGLVTALIHNYIKVPGLLAGIITMIMLYSINLRILGRSNVQFLKGDVTVLVRIDSLFSFMPREWLYVIFFMVTAAGVMLLLNFFFHTNLGLLMRAMGNNIQMIYNQGVDPRILKMIGLGLSNGIVALSGAWAAQYLKLADIGLGQGIIIAGLVSVMIGEVMIPSRRIWVITLRVLAGSIIYQLLMYLGQKYGRFVGLQTNDLKLITGLLVVVVLIISRVKTIRSARATLPKDITPGKKIPEVKG